MSDRKINPQIIDELRKNSEGDKQIADFLIELIIKEADNLPKWRWKKVYQKKLEQYSSEWRNENENS